MRYLICFLALCGPAFAQDWNDYAGDVPLTSEELNTEVVGQTLTFYDNGQSKFQKDGAYSYTYDGGGTAFGKFALQTGGVICIDFENGWSRCDKYVHVGERLVLLTEAGDRFPIRP